VSDTLDLSEFVEPHRPTPVPCRNCVHWDSEFNDWDGTYVRFCAKNIWPPYRKQSCKKQQPYKAALVPVKAGQ
jgi:hypothetical protein